MGRILNWPRGIGFSSIQPLAGPRSVGAGGGTESLGGWVQTTAGADGLNVWRFVPMFMQGRELRRWRGLIAAMQGGANAVRLTFSDPDRSWEESGFVSAPSPVTFSNGAVCSNGQRLTLSPPPVACAAPSAQYDTTVTLADQRWASDLDVGDWLGFFPFHFGLYWITDVLAPRTYRVWPPLAAAVTTSTYATLTPTSVLRMRKETDASWARDGKGSSNTELVLMEVEDGVARTSFAD